MVHPLTIDQLLSFTRRLPKLKELSIFNAPFGYNLDLAALHKERKKLAGACKLTIYLPKCINLAAKETPKNIYTNHDLIEIKLIGHANLSSCVTYFQSFMFGVLIETIIIEFDIILKKLYRIK